MFTWPGIDAQMNWQSERTGTENNWYSLTGRAVAIRISKPTMKASAGVLAQLVERLNGIEEVTGSNPVGSIFLSANRPQRRERCDFVLIR